MPTCVDGHATLPEVEQEFLVAGGAGDRRRRHADGHQSYRSGRRRHIGDHALVHGRIEHQPAGAHLVAPGLELRLHERDDVGARPEHRRHHRQDQRSEMNDTSMVTMSTRPGQLRRASRCRAFTPFEDEHARIGPQLPVELAVADVERDDVPGAALEQHVGEAAGRGADVERVAAVDVGSRTRRARARA